MRSTGYLRGDRMKVVKILAVSCAITIMSSFSAFAGWEQQADGAWKYKDEVIGAYVASQWIESATEKGLWYYLDQNGVMAVNTTVDGYYVNELGEWRESLSGGTNTSNVNVPDNNSGDNNNGISWGNPDAEFSTTPGWGDKDVIVG